MVDVLKAAERQATKARRRGARKLARTSGYLRSWLTGDPGALHRKVPYAPEHLANYSEQVVARNTERILLLSDAARTGLTDQVSACRAAFPDVPLVVVQISDGSDDLPAETTRVRYLQVADATALSVLVWQVEPFDVLIDLTDQETSRGETLWQTLYGLPDGGLYIVHDLADDGVGFGATALAERLATDPYRQEAAGQPIRSGRSLVFTKRGTHIYKLRDRHLSKPDWDRRLAPTWGKTLLRRKAFEFESRAVVEVNDETHRHRFGPTMTVRDRHLRLYRDVIAHPQQEVIRAGLAMPISYHHPNRRVQETKIGTSIADDVDRIDRPLAPPTRTLDGTYFHLISAFPSHFGHFMTEDLGRLWGWREAKRRAPDCRLLISCSPDQTGIPGWQQTMLAALGVDAADITCITDPVRVRKLIGAGPEFHNRRFIDPALGDLWDELGAALAPPAAPTGPSRIFVQRPPGGRRTCLNGDEVEQHFSDAGFTLVRPELLGVPEQVALFRGADVIAGWGGSGMFGTLYGSRPGRRIVVISSGMYTASNEYLISSVRGDHYTHFWCDAEIQHPPGEWSVEAFWSDYTFDFERDGDLLERALR